MSVTTTSRSVAYGMTAPTLDDVRAAVLATHPADGAQVWARLLGAAAVGDDGGDLVDRVVAAMTTGPDRLVAVSARSLLVRLRAYRLLTAGHDRAATA